MVLVALQFRFDTQQKKKKDLLAFVSNAVLFHFPLRFQKILLFLWLCWQLKLHLSFVMANVGERQHTHTHTHTRTRVLTNSKTFECVRVCVENFISIRFILSFSHCPSVTLIIGCMFSCVAVATAPAAAQLGNNICYQHEFNGRLVHSAAIVIYTHTHTHMHTYVLRITTTCAFGEHLQFNA